MRWDPMDTQIRVPQLELKDLWKISPKPITQSRPLKMDRSYPSKAWVVARKEECSRQKSSIQEITRRGVGTESSQGN